MSFFLCGLSDFRGVDVASGFQKIEF